MVIVTTYEKCKFFYTRKEIVITLISIESQCEFIIKDTFNKLGYKAEINNYTASRVN